MIINVDMQSYLLLNSFNNSSGFVDIKAITDGMESLAADIGLDSSTVYLPSSPTGLIRDFESMGAIVERDIGYYTITPIGKKWALELRNALKPSLQVA